jgi:hypothetical protein
VLATIGLTIPSVLVINHLIERPIITGVEHTDLCSPHPHADATSTRVVRFAQTPAIR